MRLAGVFALIVLFWTPVAAQGVLSFEQTEHDLGTIERLEPVPVSFRFSNTGDSSTRIAGVRVSCGCTVSSFTEGDVPAGASGQVDVILDPSMVAGWFRESVVVLLDDGADRSREAVLTVSGRVRPVRLPEGVDQGGVRFDQEVHDLGTVSSDASVSHRFSMHRTAGSPLAILAGHSFPAGASLRYPRIPINPDDVVRIEVTLDPASLQSGPFDFRIALETDDGDEPVKLLRLTGVRR
jgi:hypothetical protein